MKNNNDLYKKLEFIVNNCGISNTYSMDSREAYLRLGLISFEIIKDDCRFIIKYEVEYEGNVKTNYIYVGNDGIKVYFPVRRTLFDFKLSAYIVNFVQTALYKKAKIKYLDDIKKYISNFDGEKKANDQSLNLKKKPE